MAINTSTRSTQVKEHLLDWIDKNEYGQGDQLPSEAEMAKTLGVSRSTVREAYIMLEAEGVIVRKHGSGTFISNAPLIKNALVEEILGFPHDIHSSGFDFDFAIVFKGDVVPPPEIADALQIEQGEKTLLVKQVQYADGSPAIYINDYFASWIDQARFNWSKFDGHMLEFVTDSLNLPERLFASRIGAVLVDDDISTNLSVPTGKPVVNVRSLVTTMDGQPVTYSVVYFNPDSIEFELRRIYRHR